MRRIFTALCCLLYIGSIAQVNIFNGGEQDGYAANTLNATQVAPSIFNGGWQDGYAANTLNATLVAPSIFNGGWQDGYAVNTLTATQVAPSIFNGGWQDGYAFYNGITPQSCPSPTALQYLGNTGTSLRLGWTPGSGNVTYEVILIRQGSTDTFFHSGTITGSTMRDTITCLPSFTYFTYFIREGCGTYGWHSPWVNGGTVYTSPGCSAPSDQASSIVNTQNVNLSWTDNTYNNTPYQISYGVGISNAGQGTKTAVTVPTLINGRTFTHALFVSNGVANLTWFVREVCGQCDTTVWVGPNSTGSAKTDETENTSGIQTSAPNDLQLQLFPNPNNGKELNVKAMSLGADAELLVYNLQGEIVARELLKPDDITTLNVSHLADVVYLCRVTSPQISRTVRLVIQR